MSDNIGNEKDVKLITLDHIQQIKDYIDKTDANLNYRIDNELKDYISNELKQAAGHIQADYDSKYKELQDQLAYLEQFGTQEEINAIKLKIEALEGNTQNKFEALDGLERELGRLSGDYQELYDGVITGKVFNAGQLDEIINTALIEKTKITDDMVETPNVYTSNLVALIGKFGQINAANIVGGEISGHTIQSNNKMVGTDAPVWQIKDAGDGYLAQENIKWDADGNVTFGPGVKITFDNVQGAEDKLKDLMSNYDDDLQKYVEEAVKTSAAGAISREELNNRVEETQQAANDAIAALQQVVDNNDKNIKSKLEEQLNTVNAAIEQARKDGNAELEAGLLALKEALEGQLATAVADVRQSLTDAIDAVDESIEAKYQLASSDLQNALKEVDIAIEKAVSEGNIEMVEKLAELRGELSGVVNTMNRELTQVNTAISSLRGDISNLQNSALDANSIGELLAAAMIEKTEISETQVVTPSLLAKKIVGLIGTFGTINASKIVGTNIQGYTVSSPLDVKDENGNPVYTDEFEPALDDNGNPMYDESGNPIYTTMLNPETGEYEPVRKKQQIPITQAAWVLNQDGTGHLAKGQIEWHYDKDDNGKDTTVVTFGDSVKINWNNVEGGIEYVDGIATTVRGEFKDQLDLELNLALKEMNGSLGSVDTGLRKELSTLQGDLEGQLNESSAQINKLNGDVNTINGNISTINGDINTINGDINTINGDINTINGNISGIQTNVDTLSNTVDNLQKDVNDANNTIKGIADTEIFKEGIFTGTIRSSAYEVTENGEVTLTPYWKLGYLGEGHLAKGNISWDKDGNVTFGPDVTIKWENVTGGDDAVNNAVGDIDGKVNAAVNDGLKDVVGDLDNISNFATQISAKGVYTGEIASKCDSEGNIASDAAWVVKNDGSGYLANGNINWDKDGNVGILGHIIPQWTSATRNGTIDIHNPYTEYNIVGSIFITGYHKVQKSQLYYVAGAEMTTDEWPVFLTLPSTDDWNGVTITILNAGGYHLPVNNLFAFSSAGTPHVTNVRGEIYDDASKLVEKLYIGPGQIAQFVATDVYPKDILEYTTKCYKSGSDYRNQNVGLTEGSMVWLPLNNVYVPRSTSVASI